MTVERMYLQLEDYWNDDARVNESYTKALEAAGEDSYTVLNDCLHLERVQAFKRGLSVGLGLMRELT
jgi:hypothetical protein